MADTVLMASSYTQRIGQAQYAPYGFFAQSVDMDEMHDRLKAAREAAGFATAAEAARAMNIPEGRYAHHENGTRKMKYDVAERYAEKFKTTAEWLIGGKQRAAAGGGPKQTRDVVRLSWVAAGRLGPVAPVESVGAEGRFRADGLPAGDWVALEVRGRSMERIAPEGSTIIVNRADRTLLNGRYYVIVSDDGEGQFKRYRANPARFLPYSLDADEEPIYPDLNGGPEWTVFGRVHRVLIDV
jgi:SOS-response transcriptional repressor LexA